MMPVLTAVMDGPTPVPTTVEVGCRACGRAPETPQERERVCRVGAALGAAGQPYGRPLRPMGPAAPSTDLAVAVAAAGFQVPKGFGFLGELALDGRLRDVRGSFAMARALATGGATTVVLPARAKVPPGLVPARLLEADQLAAVLSHLRGDYPLPMFRWSPPLVAPHPTFRDLQGLDEAKQALLSAVQSGSSVLLVGPPGCGKTALARRVVAELPPPSPDLVLEMALAASVAGIDVIPGVQPFRAPHHTCSLQGMTGSPSRPSGELQLAKGGVLLLDDAQEFHPQVLRAIQHARHQEAGFFLVGTAPPCPCGHAPTERCRCSPARIAHHQARIPNLFDVTVTVPPQPTVRP